MAQSGEGLRAQLVIICRADVGKLVRHGFGEFGHGQTVRQALRDGGVEFCRVARGNGGGDGQQGELFGFQAA